MNQCHRRPRAVLSALALTAASLTAVAVVSAPAITAPAQAQEQEQAPEQAQQEAPAEAIQEPSSGASTPMTMPNAPVAPADGSTQATSTEAPSALQPATQPDVHRGDIWVPDWMLLLVAAVVVAGAVAVATQSYLRFSQTRKDLEG